MLIAEGWVKINADDLAFTRDIDRVERNFKRSVADMERHARQASQALAVAGTAIALSAGKMAQSFIGAGMEMENMMRGLTAVTGSASLAQSQLEGLREVAKLPGLGLQEAVQGSINLQAVRFSAERATYYLSEMGNALATVGKGRAELTGVVRGMQQMQSRGKVLAEEINQISERVPQFRAAMLDAFGTATSEEIQKMGITVEQFLDRTVNELEKLPRVAGGTANAIENLRDSWFALRVELGEHLLPTFASIVDGLAEIVSSFNELDDTSKKLISWTTVAVAGLGAVAGSIGILGLALPRIFEGFKSIGIVVANLSPMARYATGIGLLAAEFVVLALAIQKAYKHWKMWQDGIITDKEHVEQWTKNTKGQLEALAMLGKALNYQRERGLDPYAAKISDLEVSIARLSELTDTNVSDTANAVVVYERWARNLDETNKHIKALGGTTLKISTPFAKMSKAEKEAAERAKELAEALKKLREELVELDRTFLAIPELPTIEEKTAAAATRMEGRIAETPEIIPYPREVRPARLLPFPRMIPPVFMGQRGYGEVDRTEDPRIMEEQYRQSAKSVTNDMLNIWANYLGRLRAARTAEDERWAERAFELAIRDNARIMENSIRFKEEEAARELQIELELDDLIARTAEARMERVAQRQKELGDEMIAGIQARAKQAEQEQLEQSAAAAERSEQIWLNVSTAIESELSRMFEDILQGELDSWEKFWEEIKDMGIRYMAQLAAWAAAAGIMKALTAAGIAPGFTQAEQSTDIASGLTQAGQSGGGGGGSGIAAGATIGATIGSAGSGIAAGATIGATIGSAVPGIGTAIGTAIGAVLGGVFMGEGGIVTKPTLAVIGEKGPEAVVPINKIQGMGNVTTINPVINITGADISSMSQGESDIFFENKIIRSMENAAKKGLLNRSLLGR